MITKNNFKDVLEVLGFKKEGDIYRYNDLKVDFQNEKLIYPKKLIVNDETTSNFSAPENFVVFECVYRLLKQGYSPSHIELENSGSPEYLRSRSS